MYQKGYGKKLKRGFTMIELMLVMALGITLAMYAVPRFKDSSNANQAREEAAKLSDLKSVISNTYQYSTEFDSLAGIFARIAPTTFERVGAAVYSDWKNPIIAVGNTAAATYTITYNKVPSGKSCQGFVGAAQSHEWFSMTIGGAVLDADSAIDEIIDACGATLGSQNDTVNIDFLYNPRG